MKEYDGLVKMLAQAQQQIGLLCIAAENGIHKIYINGDMDVAPPSVQDLVCCYNDLHKEVASNAVLCCCWCSFPLQRETLPSLNACNMLCPSDTKCRIQIDESHTHKT